MFSGYQHPYYPPTIGNDMYSVGHDMTRHPLYSRAPAVLPIFQRVGIQLHDRIESGMRDEPDPGPDEHLPHDQPDLPSFRKRGKRGGVKHRLALLNGASSTT